ncbi:uncharacterized protein LOC119350575 [Triticum dicoccoides]|uniref:uncharacterized protein LOC119350575 n=1 Tax=Triticum dicoccoides TaxID=85692 RepID=UPI00188FA3CB|nr:uncharacterized protein LOC119350575 [Triticum dicoccoides]
MPGAAAVAAGLRRSLCTARTRSRPPWALIQRASVDESGAPAPGVTFRAVDCEPPSVAGLTFPAHLVHPRRPGAGDGGFVSGQVAAASGGQEEDEGGFVMRRFLSETGKWDMVAGLPSPLPAGRKMDIDNAVVAFGDRLWWIDESWGAISVDPLSDRPELRFVELPRSSVLPDLDGLVLKTLMKTLGSHRRMGVSEGKMRYIEVSMEKPYVISLFSLDDGGSSWTLDYETAFAPIWDDALLCSAPLEQMLTIGAINPLKANIVYLACGDKILGVDMVTKKITGISGLAIAVPDLPLLPCVLPTWLESSQIPSAGWSKKNTRKSEVSPNTVKRENLHVEIELLK